MKKIFILLCFSILTSCFIYRNGTGNGTIRLSTRINGYWNGWKNYNSSGLYMNEERSVIAIYDPSAHPSDYMFMMRISNYTKPSNEKLKEYRKKELTFDYYGVVEYYIDDEYPNITKQLKEEGYPCVSPRGHDTSKGQMPCKKITSNAIITLQSFYDKPLVYNIFFDDVGFAISLADY